MSGTVKKKKDKLYSGRSDKDFLKRVQSISHRFLPVNYFNWNFNELVHKMQSNHVRDSMPRLPNKYERHNNAVHY